MRVVRIGLTTLVIGLGSTVPFVYAADTCFNASGVTIVAQAFVKPARGACRPFLGNIGESMVSGIVCTNTAGTMLRIGYTSHPNNGAGVEIGQMNLPLPSMTGGETNFRILGIDDTGGLDNGAGSVIPCSPAVQPIP